MNCPRCQTPNPTHARFCLNCGWAMTRKCTSCSSDLLPGARFCMHCGHPVIETTPVDSNRFARVAAAAPETLVEKVRAASKFTGERRVVTILFVDVVASTALSERLGVQTWTAVVNQMEEEVIPIVYRYEGTIARILGDSLLAFFGAPVAHEDDPARAVRAAIDDVDRTGNDIGLVAGRTGSLMRRVELTARRLEEEDIELRALFSQVVDANFAETVVRLQQQQNALEATLKSAANVLPLSLVNFL